MHTSCIWRKGHHDANEVAPVLLRRSRPRRSSRDDRRRRPTPASGALHPPEPSAVGGVRAEGAGRRKGASAPQVRERPSAAGNARIGRPRRRTRKRPKELVGTGHSTGPVATASRSLWSPPGSSLAGLATIEPGSRDRPEDHSSDRSGGSHLPLRARRNVQAGIRAPQGACPRTSMGLSRSYPRTSHRCGRAVDTLRLQGGTQGWLDCWRGSWRPRIGGPDRSATSIIDG